jgi:ATP-dependent Lhr-like helicase
VIALAATDPANAYGTVLSWPQSDGRMARAAGAYCVLDDGRIVLYLERGGRSLLTNGEVQPAHLHALISIATSAGRVELQKVDGVSVMDSPLKAALREAGFSQTHRALVAYGARP